MTHRGPFQPLLFCDSVILCGEELKRACAGQETQLPAVRATEAAAGAEPWGSIAGTGCTWR